MSETILTIIDSQRDVVAKLLASGDPAPTEAGTILKADSTKRFLLTVAYPALKADAGVAADGFRDFARADAVEKACWNFAHKGLKLGLWHEAGHEDCGEVVENFIYRNETPWVIKSPSGTIETICFGDWVTGEILSPYAWKMYEDGLIGGASPQGPCERDLHPDPAVLATLR